MTDFCEYGGCVGSLWMDEVPRLDHARVRPFVVALLLYRGAARSSELVNMISSVCHREDCLEGAWDHFEQDWADIPMIEKFILEVLGEMTGSGLLRYNEERDLWVLTENNMHEVLNWVSSCGGRLPRHLVY